MPTCHWCHVMERESFEDMEVAEILNRHFISIKVDREERSDIDAVYMNVCQALTGSGGWPLTIIITPDKNPFFAGTYFPKRRKYMQTGLIELLNTVADKWTTQQESLIQSGNSIAIEIERRHHSGYRDNREPDRKQAYQALSALAGVFDNNYGGFGGAPKFPSPHNLLFLMHCHSLGISGKALEMSEKTLEFMYRGGIFDHVGYGFSHYSTDEKWLVPHFEKMLYDNALLTVAYCRAYQITGKELYSYVAEKTLKYVGREMTHELGGFYSAQDADSEGEEGKYYTWNYEEIIALLGQDDGNWFCARYDVNKAGNFDGKTVLNKLADHAAQVPDERTERLLEALRQARFKRYRLHKDDKILTSWNAMMIAAYAVAGNVFDNSEYMETAKKALRFTNTWLKDENGRLKVSFRDGKAGGVGMLDDYAYLSWACLELYNGTFNPDYLKQSLDLIRIVEDEFSDVDGGFFLSPSYGEKLIYRPKEFYDGAVPSGNSVLAYSLVNLSKLIGQPELQELADWQLKAFSHWFYQQPTACTFALKALLQEVYPGKELVCAVNSASEASKIIRELSGKYFPQLTVHIITPENKDRLVTIVPFLSGYSIDESQPAVFYLCQNQVCSKPLNNLQDVIKELESTRLAQV